MTYLGQNGVGAVPLGTIYLVEVHFLSWTYKCHHSYGSLMVRAFSDPFNRALSSQDGGGGDPHTEPRRTHKSG